MKHLTKNTAAIAVAGAIAGGTLVALSTQQPAQIECIYKPNNFKFCISDDQCPPPGVPEGIFERSENGSC